MNPTISKKTSNKVSSNGPIKSNTTPEPIVEATKRKAKKTETTKAKKPENPLAALARERLRIVKEEEDKIRAIQEEEERKIRAEEEAAFAAAKIIAEQKLKEKIRNQRSISTTSVINSSEVEVEVESSVVVTPTIQFRSPIVCIMGHVDTGKTKILDKLRNTNVQEGEVAGITQQIGATFIPKTSINRKINEDVIISIPGLLMIDTPGHEAFLNLRKIGSTLADIVILVIDLFGGVEQQTIESLNILKKFNIKFIIALNKIDRLYGWKSVENSSIQNALKTNNEIYSDEFNHKLYRIKGNLQEQGINAELFWENKSVKDTVSICPLSAITGEVISVLFHLIVTISEVELTEQITLTDQLKCIVMEKKVVDNMGITIDALLISGTLNKGDNILIKTNNGQVKTQIRNLLTPPPNCESRVATIYNPNMSLTGAIGFKLFASNLENILIGSDIIIDTNNFEEEDIHYSSSTVKSTTQFNLRENGVLVFSSTEGSLVALMYQLQVICNPPVPVSAAIVGNVIKKHVTKMIISNNNDYKEINTILAFNVTIDEEAQKLAQSKNITIFTDETIYRLCKQYTDFRTTCKNERKDANKHLIVYPCVLNILKKFCSQPLLLGVKVIDGNLHINTPLIITNKKLIIGKVVSIQNNGKDIQSACKGSEVCIKIENDGRHNYTFGRHFNLNDTIVSYVTQNSINIMNTHFKDEITNETGLLLNSLLS